MKSWRILLICALALLPSQALAQTVPFGKNKIQYREFEWQILPGEHVDVYYYPEEEDVAKLALQYAEESYEFLEKKFQHHPFRRIPLIVYSSDQHFEQTNVFPGFIPEGVLGFTEYLKRRVALPFRGDYNQFRNTLRHELVHAFQISKISEVTSAHPRIRRASPQQIHWWTEGLAEYWSSEQTAEDEMFVRDLVVRGREWVQKARNSADPDFYLHADACAKLALEAVPRLREERMRRFPQEPCERRGVLGPEPR